MNIFDKKIFFLVVHKGVFRGEYVAIKKFDGSCPVSCKKQLENEIQILGRLEHENIIKLFGFCDQRNNNFLVLEYMEGGSLFDLLSSDEENISSCKLIQGICNGMEYLHNNSVLHLDLKSSNIILNKRKDQAKITDFGISKISTLTSMNSSNIRTKSARGTFRWMAPEISNGFPGTRSSDVWSFGCILIEIMTRKLPFYSLNDQQLLTVLQNQKSDLPINIQNFSKILAGVLFECLKREPNKRPTFNQIKVSLSKCTQNDFNFKKIENETNSLRTLNDLNNYIENVKKSKEEENKKDQEIQELKKKLNEKEKDICSVTNNLAELTKKVNDLTIANQVRQIYSTSVLSPPDTPTNYFSQNRPSCYTPSYSLIRSPPDTPTNYFAQNKPSLPTPNHSGRDTGYTYVSSGSANGRTIYEGPRGGTYYLSSSGKKVYGKFN